MAERTQVFARVSPAQKHRILHALKAGGHVVGFLGDGINDAPSLHAADVGISVAGAVDVAREASDIILLERNLDVLHAGILGGRRAFGNVLKYLLMGTSSNFGNMFSMAGAALFLPFLPMLPTQILLNNLLYDLAQLTIPTDNVDAGYTARPRRWDISVIRRFMLVIGPVSSLFDFLTFGVLLYAFHFAQAAFQTGWFVESLATQVLVLFVIRTTGQALDQPPEPAAGDHRDPRGRRRNPRSVLSARAAARNDPAAGELPRLRRARGPELPRPRRAREGEGAEPNRAPRIAGVVVSPETQPRVPDE